MWIALKIVYQHPLYISLLLCTLFGWLELIFIAPIANRVIGSLDGQFYILSDELHCNIRLIL